MFGIEIIGTGSYVPEFVADNNKFAEFLDTSDEWITPRTGIKERHIMTDKPNYYMGARAAEAALENAKMDAKDIDLILVSTCSPDFFYPCMACLIQKRIGADNAACMDVNSACTGFITALDVAQKYLASGAYKNILVIATEKLSAQQDYTDRSMCILFGDAAGAAVVRRSEKQFYSALGAAGDEFEALYCKINYQSNCPFYEDNAPFFNNRFDTFSKQNYLQSDGHAVYKFAVNAMNNAVRNVVEQAGWNIDDIEIVVPHQANLRIINKARELLGISPEKVYTNIQRLGNVSSACIPVALDELNRAGKLHSGMKICFVGFGAGLTYGAIIMEI
ncbi:MAG: 3-oxoacyl-ACP synthase III family protein [Oscillospiraceae bacterium]